MSCGGGAVRVLGVSVLPPALGLLEAAKVREPPGIRGGPGGPLPGVPGRSSRWQHKTQPGPWDCGLPGRALPGHCAEVVSLRHQPSIPGQRTPPEVSRPRWALCSPGRVGGGCPLVASPAGDRAPEAPGHTWENCAKVRSASMGTCPSSSWQQSLCWGRRVGGAGAPRAGSLSPPTPDSPSRPPPQARG